ncbi:MAG: hypothetical protein ACXVHV_08345 [Methanobacterium sp.]
MKTKMVWIIAILVLLVAISGCASQSKQYNGDNYSFSYPNNWNITYGGSEGIVFNAPGLLLGTIIVKELPSGQSPEDYLKTNYNQTEWSNAAQKNGNTYYNGSQISTQGQLHIKTNLGVFLKGNTLYIIRIKGGEDANKGFEQIRDSFNIK